MMEAIYVFLIRNDVWIYIICGLGIIWYLSQLVRSRRMLRRSMFGLEIERGRRIMTRSLILVVLFIAIAGTVTYVNLGIAPTLPADLLKPPTPTPNIFATPLSSPTPAGGQQPTPTIVLAPTVTLAAPGPFETPSLEEQVETELPVVDEQQPTQEPTAVPSRQNINCSAEINISSPPTGAVASSVVTFFGTASAESFGNYALEVNGPRTGGEWTALPLGESNRQVFDSILGSVDVSTWPSGAYSFRLSVYDLGDVVVGQCEIQLSLATGNS